MFARTSRLTLRPPWPEDAAALTVAIGHERVARNLARVPWPYTAADAAAFVGQKRPIDELVSVILVHDGPPGAAPRLAGVIGIHPEPHGAEFGYWLTPDAWGRGYATEAGRAMLAAARHTLGLIELHAGHFTDNPASGRVLAKLGFKPTGEVREQYSVARRGTAASIRMRLDLDETEALPRAA